MDKLVGKVQLKVSKPLVVLLENENPVGSESAAEAGCESETKEPQIAKNVASNTDDLFRSFFN